MVVNSGDLHDRTGKKKTPNKNKSKNTCNPQKLTRSEWVILKQVPKSANDSVNKSN